MKMNLLKEREREPYEHVKSNSGEKGTEKRYITIKDNISDACGASP